LARTQNLEGLSHQSWSTENGLPQNSIHSIAQTSDGFIWAATEAGLARFDGIQFDVFDQRTNPVLRSSDICCLVADSQSGIWAGTRDGLVHRTPDGFVWYGTKDGLPSTEITGLSRDRHGILVVTTASGAVQWPRPARGAPAASSVAAPQRASGPWSWTKDEVQLQSSTATRHWRAGVELPSGRVSVLAVDREGYAWVGMTSGVVVINPATSLAHQVPAMKGTSVLSLFEDVEGNHWIGTESAGLHILRRPLFRGVPALAESPTTAVVQTKDGAAWIGTRDNGIYRVRDGIVNQPVPSRSLTSSVILCLQPALDGGLWVGTPDGLNHVTAGARVHHITTINGLPDDYIRSLAVASDGSLWVGTRHGLDHLQGEQHRILTSLDGLGGDLIGAILIDAKTAAAPTLWVATSGGLSRIEGDGAIRTFTSADGLTSPIVTALALDSAGRLWIATGDGMIAVLDAARFRPLFSINLSGRGERTVKSVTLDRTGSLWIQMDRGIARIRAIQLDRCLQHSPCKLQSEWITRYGSADGLRNDEAVATAMGLPWLMAQAELWFPTRAGIAIADIASLREDQKGPPVAIERVLIDEQPVNVQNHIPEVPYGSRRLLIEYAGLDFVSPSGVQYRCRLDGFDHDWQMVGNRRSITYTNLSPGLYTFLVQARTTDGDWGTAETTIRLRILRPFYQHWWFVALVAVLLCAFLGGLYLLRLRVLQHRFNAVLAERNRMAREIHDTLTQDFVSTCLQLDIVAQQLKRGQVEKAIEQVQRARRFVTEGLAEARQSIWELRSSNTREPLPSRLAHLTEREAFSSIRPHLEVQGAYRPLSPRAEREILRLANEALVNIVRHANSEEAQLTLYYSEETLMLTVEDRGRGFDVERVAQMEGHFGLTGMRERASVVDGNLEIISVRGHGTTVRLRVPLDALSEERRGDE
jgi:signal transduction histidine kinase